MKCDHLYEEFRKYEGQPVRIFTDDEKSYCGIVITPYDDAVRILDKCSRTVLVEYVHIAAVTEPMMELKRCCRNSCNCHEGDDYGDRDRDRDYDEGERDKDCDRDRY